MSPRTLGHAAMSWLVALASTMVAAWDQENGYHLSFSDRVGRGATAAKLGMTDGDDVIDFLSDFDPNKAAEEPAEKATLDCIRDSIGVEEDDGKQFVTFKWSNAKNTRAFRVPVNEWSGFVAELDRNLANLKTLAEQDIKARAEEAEKNASK